MNLFDFEFSHIPDADIFPGADFPLVKLFDIEFSHIPGADIFPVDLFDLILAISRCRYFSSGPI